MYAGTPAASPTGKKPGILSRGIGETEWPMAILDEPLVIWLNDLPVKPSLPLVCFPKNMRFRPNQQVEHYLQ